MASKEMLYLFRTVDDWNEAHSERHLVSIPGHVTLLDLRLQLPHDVNAHAFSKYVRSYLRGKSLMATKEAIHSPFLQKQTTMDQREALEVFKLILAHSMETSLTDKRKRLVADLIIQKGLSNDALRDEIFVQLVNQTLYNGRGYGDPHSPWMLIAGCLGAFQPSHNLAKYLLKYVSDSQNSFGYGVVAQQKLLHGLGTDHRVPRVYPPCLLEWTAIRLRSSMALTAAFADGVSNKGQVESWTTAEEFAANLLKSRRASGGFLGWTVMLRDDRESYECAGHHYVLDLLSEIEVVPGFPCGTAYFLVTSDLSRPSVHGRFKRSDQPHNADRLRLMPLEVDELPDSAFVVALNSAPVLSPRAPVTPQPSPVQSPRKAPSPVPVPVPIPVPAPAPAPAPAPVPEPLVRHEDPYVLRDDAVSHGSALNKRPEKVPGIISKSSALNNRYHNVPDPVAKQPPAPAANRNSVPPRLPPRGAQNGVGPSPNRQAHGAHENGTDMDEWLESVFKVVDDGARVGDLKNPAVMERRIKGGGDDLTQFSFPVNGGLGVGYGLQSPYGFQPATIPTTPLLSPPLLQQPIINQTYAPQPLMTTPSYMAQPTANIAGIAPYGSADHSYLYRQQQEQRQRQMSQQTAELQARLQQQELEKRVLQTSLETELLKSQLNHMKGHQTRSISPAENDINHKQYHNQKPAKRNSVEYPAVRRRPSYREPVEDEFEEYDADDDKRNKRTTREVRSTMSPARSHSSHVTKPVMMHGSNDDSPPRRSKKSTAHMNGSTTPSSDEQHPHSILRNSSQKGVTFSNDVKVSKSNKAVPNESSNHVSSKSAPHQYKDQHKSTESSNSDNDVKKDKVVVVVTRAPSPPPAAKAPKAAAADKPRLASGAVGSQRRPPVKIGQIIWPPPPKDDDRPKLEPGRLMIDEKKEGKEKGVLRSTSSEDAQKKVHNKIQNARKKASESEEEDAKKKPPPVKRRPPLPSSESMTPTSASPRDDVFEVENYHTLDMKTRQKTLERQLNMVSWGTQGKKKTEPQKKAEPIPPPPPPPQTAVYAPLPPPPPANHHHHHQPVERVEVSAPPISPFDLSSMDNIRTVLYAQCTDPFHTYANADWTLEIRKEVFRPHERLADLDLVYLVFCQIVFDVFELNCIRLSQEDRRKMTAHLDRVRVHPNNVTGDHPQSTMTSIIDAAKDLPIYFSRIFAVNGGRRNRKVQMVGVSHSGVRLLTRVTDGFEDYIEVIERIGFQDILSVTVPKEGALLIRSTGKSLAVYSPKVNQICKMIESFRIESNKISQPVSKMNGYDVLRF